MTTYLYDFLKATLAETMATTTDPAERQKIADLQTDLYHATTDCCAENEPEVALISDRGVIDFINMATYDTYGELYAKNNFEVKPAFAEYLEAVRDYHDCGCFTADILYAGFEVISDLYEENLQDLNEPVTHFYNGTFVHYIPSGPHGIAKKRERSFNDGVHTTKLTFRDCHVQYIHITRDMIFSSYMTWPELTKFISHNDIAIPKDGAKTEANQFKSYDITDCQPYYLRDEFAQDIEIELLAALRHLKSGSTVGGITKSFPESTKHDSDDNKINLDDVAEASKHHPGVVFNSDGTVYSPLPQDELNETPADRDHKLYKLIGRIMPDHEDIARSLAESLLLRDILTYCCVRPCAEITISVEHKDGHKASFKYFDSAFFVDSLFDLIANFQNEIYDDMYYLLK